MVSKAFQVLSGKYYTTEQGIALANMIHPLQTLRNEQYTTNQEQTQRTDQAACDHNLDSLGVLSVVVAVELDLRVR